MPARRRYDRLSLRHAFVATGGLVWGTILGIGLFGAGPSPPVSEQTANSDRMTNWGSDHVGLPTPEYVTGDECLFCHRDDFGNRWSRNAHQLTIRPAEPDGPAITALKAALETGPLAPDVELLMGERRHVRYLKRSGDYGKLLLLSAAFTPSGRSPKTRQPHGTLLGTKGARWDDSTFARSCAGCHTTAVDPRTHAFAAISLDCCTCHGVVDLTHSKDAKRVYFGKGRNDPPRVVAAICGQCHLRGGKSRSTGLPYPNNFVAGDNLFRDFQVSLTDANLAAMNPADRHVAQNVREIFAGNSQTSCVQCHDVHRQSTARHRQVAEGATCATCHEPGKPRSQHKRYEVHSALCGY